MNLKSDNTYLKLSIVIILLMWLWKLVSNIIIYDAQYFQSLSFQTVALKALGIATITILIVLGLTFLSKENFRDLGFVKEKVLKQILTGLLFGFVIFIVAQFIADPLINLLIPGVDKQGADMKNLFSNINDLPVWIILATYKAGFSEELLRIFILTKFEKAFGRKGLIFALVAGSLLFGVGHLYQGISGFISISIIGFLYALVYLRKRSAIEVMTAHAVFDLIGITLGYIIYS